MQKDPGRRRFPLSDRVIEVVDNTLTGEVLLDEALKMMKTSEKMSVASWIDLMSGRWQIQQCAARNADKFRRDMEPDEDWLPAEAGT